jgi:DNA-directed RNA polymerase specialized sigma24 family protein
VRSEWPESAAEAFARADWERLMPQLLRGAQRCLTVLGWAETRGGRPAVLEARELVGSAIEGLLAGRRTWVASAGATEGSLVAFLCMTMRSLAMNQRTSAAVASPRAEMAELADLPAGDPSPERQSAARSVLASVEGALADDGEAMQLYRVVCESESHGEELAAALGWTVEHTKTVRQRMRRRLAERRVAPLDDEME